MFTEKDLEPLNEAILKGDYPGVAEALGALARQYGISKIAKELGLFRESLYRSLSRKGNPSFATFFNVARVMGIQMVVTVKE